MTAIDPWPFGDDARRKDPLIAHRIAVTCSHPMWRYLVAFDYDSEARPTDAEALMLRSFLDNYKDYWYGQGSFRRQMEQRLLDVDGGANGVVFHKWDTDDWGFRRHSFERGYLFSVIPPTLRGHWSDGIPGPLSLAQVMDRLHTLGDDKPSRRWLDWKAAHPEVFGAGGAS